MKQGNDGSNLPAPEHVVSSNKNVGCNVMDHVFPEILSVLFQMRCNQAVVGFKEIARAHKEVRSHYCLILKVVDWEILSPFPHNIKLLFASKSPRQVFSLVQSINGNTVTKASPEELHEVVRLFVCSEDPLQFVLSRLLSHIVVKPLENAKFDWGFA